MRSLGVVMHFSEPELVTPEMVTPVLGVEEALSGEAFFLVGSVAAFDNAVFPGAAFLDQGVDAPTRFNGFGKGGFAFGMSGVAQGEIHGVVGESYEKGGRLSIAFW